MKNKRRSRERKNRKKKRKYVTYWISHIGNCVRKCFFFVFTMNVENAKKSISHIKKNIANLLAPDFIFMRTMHTHTFNLFNKKSIDNDFHIYTTFFLLHPSVCLYAIRFRSFLHCLFMVRWGIEYVFVSVMLFISFHFIRTFNFCCCCFASILCWLLLYCCLFSYSLTIQSPITREIEKDRRQNKLLRELFLSFFKEKEARTHANIPFKLF